MPEKMPKKFERFRGEDPKYMRFDSSYGWRQRVYICGKPPGAPWTHVYTGAMEFKNAEKLLEEYKAFWEETHA